MHEILYIVSNVPTGVQRKQFIFWCQDYIKLQNLNEKLNQLLKVGSLFYSILPVYIGCSECRTRRQIMVSELKPNTFLLGGNLSKTLGVYGFYGIHQR